MKLINVLTVETKDIDKTKQLIELWKDKLTDWDMKGKTYSLVDPMKGELVHTQVWTCLAEQSDFEKFAVALATTVDTDLYQCDVQDNLFKII